MSDMRMVFRLVMLRISRDRKTPGTLTCCNHRRSAEDGAPARVTVKNMDLDSLSSVKKYDFSSYSVCQEVHTLILHCVCQEVPTLTLHCVCQEVPTLMCFGNPKKDFQPSSILNSTVIGVQH